MKNIIISLIKKFIIFVLIGPSLPKEKKININKFLQTISILNKEIEKLQRQIINCESLEEIYFLEEKLFHSTKTFDKEYENIFQSLEKKKNKLQILKKSNH